MSSGHSVENGEPMTAEDVAAWFNDEHPVGTPVTYWPGAKDGEARQGETRSPAWVLPSGDPVVAITGYAGGIALTHVVCARHHTHAIESDTRPIPPGVQEVDDDAQRPTP